MRIYKVVEYWIWTFCLVIQRILQLLGFALIDREIQGELGLSFRSLVCSSLSRNIYDCGNIYTFIHICVWINLYSQPQAYFVNQCCYHNIIIISNCIWVWWVCMAHSLDSPLISSIMIIIFHWWICVSFWLSNIFNNDDNNNSYCWWKLIETRIFNHYFS